MLRFLFSFRGRLRRSRYLLTLLAVPLALWFLPALANELAWRSGLPWTYASGAAWLLGLYALLAVPLMAMTVRRLHDIGTTGFWALALLAPWVGWVIYALILLWPSQNGDNRYGPDPYAAEGSGTV